MLAITMLDSIYLFSRETEHSPACLTLAGRSIRPIPSAPESGPRMRPGAPQGFPLAPKCGLCNYRMHTAGTRGRAGFSTPGANKDSPPRWTTCGPITSFPEPTGMRGGSTGRWSAHSSLVLMTLRCDSTVLGLTSQLLRRSRPCSTPGRSSRTPATRDWRALPRDCSPGAFPTAARCRSLVVIWGLR